MLRFFFFFLTQAAFKLEIFLSQAPRYWITGVPHCAWLLLQCFLRCLLIVCLL
jgi:hypothetical protein